MIPSKSISLAAGALLLASLASAQGPGTGRRMRMYNPATETTIQGAVQEVKQVTRGPRMTGTHLLVKVGEETTEVMLGPSTFISKQGFSFAKGDPVAVTGSKITMDGVNYVIAREVVKDGKTLVLRDKDGRPQWAGARMGRGTPPK